MPLVILTVLNTLQAASGAYNLYLASVAIPKLQKYEETSKTAAKYSNAAEKELHKTRTTQASGTLAVFLSFLSSTTLLFYPFVEGEVPAVATLAIAGANLAALMGARKHVGDYWKGKMKMPLPGVGEYNDAVGITQEVRLNMGCLVGSWVVVGSLGLVL